MRRHGVDYAIFTLLILIFAAAPTSAFGQFSALYNFGSTSDDGRNPTFSGVVAQGRDGNLYTTTPSGGTGNGTVLQITPAGTTAVLHSFIGTDGSQPSGGLTLGTDGSLYGTTAQGGACCNWNGRADPGYRRRVGCWCGKTKPGKWRFTIAITVWCSANGRRLLKR